MVPGKYLRDYTLQDTLGPDGRIRSVSVYTGPQFRYTADAETLKAARRRFRITAAASCALALVPLLVYTPVIRCWYVMPPLACALLPVGVLAFDAVSLLRKERLTRRERDRAAAIAPWSAVLLSMSLLSLLGQAFYAFRGLYAPTDWPVTLSALALAGASCYLVSLRRAFSTEEIAAE